MSIVNESKSKILDEKDAIYFEELILKCIRTTLSSGSVDVWQVQLLLSEIPKFWHLKYPVIKEIKNLCIKMMPQIMNFKRIRSEWSDYRYLDYMLNLLKSDNEVTL